jgi:hypothetical protein
MSSSGKNVTPYPGALAVGDSTLPRTSIAGASAAIPNNSLRLTYFTATRTEVITQVSCPNAAVSAGATLQRIGIYQEMPDGSVALVASTASDVNMWTIAVSEYATALQAAFTKVQGVRYAVGMLIVGATSSPTFFGNSSLLNFTMARAPRLSALVNGVNDLPDTISTGALSVSQGLTYFQLIP